MKRAVNTGVITSYVLQFFDEDKGAWLPYKGIFSYSRYDDEAAFAAAEKLIAEVRNFGEKRDLRLIKVLGSDTSA